MRKFNFTKSLKMYEEALKYLPAGVGSNARVWRTGLCKPGLPCSLFVKKAKGAYMWDVDGNKYIDYRLGYGPVILGHDFHAVGNAVHKAEELGTVYAAGHHLEIEVAKKIRSIVKCAEMMRFSSTGTEATMNAVRLARAYTGKDKIIKFEGHFHGTHDYVLFSVDFPFNWPKRKFNQKLFPQSKGIPKVIRKTMIAERWNDFEAIEKTMKKEHDKVAAIITEPIMGNMGALMPQPNYLKHLRELCDKYDVLLIFDEVKTGFRASLGGAQELFGVTPDLATIAKAMSNGYPISALVGKREIMRMIGPGSVAHGGTYSSNPMSLAAVNATLDFMKNGKVHKHIQWYGKKLINGISEVLTDQKVPHLINGIPGMFQVMFTRQQTLKEFRDLKSCELDLYPLLQVELMKHGVVTDHDIEEPLFTSYSHGKEELNKTIEAYDNACLKTCKKFRIPHRD